MFSFFKTRADKPLIEDPLVMRRVYERKRWSVFLSLLFGYSFYYICRSVFSVMKKDMIDGKILDVKQLGNLDSAYFVTYAAGKFTNGVLADHANISRFISTGLLCSSLLVLLLGFNTYYAVFLVVWGVHGWVQSMGASPAGASLSQWFSNRERGTRYGVWSTAHSIGEGLNFVITGTVVAYFGWRWGFWGAGGISLLIAFILYWTLADRPQTYGLPAVADYKDDHASEPEVAPVSIGRAQREVLKNPYVWIVGLASACMYITRYGVNGWGILYLQESKEYSLVAASLLFGVAKISETVGTVACGFISDTFFNARRNVTTLVYGLLMVVGLGLFWAAPTTHFCDLDPAAVADLREGPIPPNLAAELSQRGVPLGREAHLVADPKDKTSWVIRQTFLGIVINKYRIAEPQGKPALFMMYHTLHVVSTACFGFGIGGLLAFLGGLIAIDICSKKASGAAMGMVGMFSYIGAAVQGWVTGKLLAAGQTEVAGHITHNFTGAMTFWFCASVISVLLACCLWNVKPRD